MGNVLFPRKRKCWEEKASQQRRWRSLLEFSPVHTQQCWSAKQLHLEPWEEWVSSSDSESLSSSGGWRWRSLAVDGSADLLGDCLAAKLCEVELSSPAFDATLYLRTDLREQLEEYEKEDRLLVKLASTGRVVQILERGIEIALDLLKIRDPVDRTLWHLALLRERHQRTKLYMELLVDEERLELEVGDERQQLEILTLLRYGTEHYADALTPRDFDVMSAFFSEVTRRANLVVVTLPDWFTMARSEWALGMKSDVSGGEEACVRQAAVWAELHHPHVRKFFGACHIGNTFAVHNLSQRLKEDTVNWRMLLDCALGLQYVHDRGLVHRNLSPDMLLSSFMDQTGLLSGLDLLQLREMNSQQARSDSDVSGIARVKLPSVDEDVKAFALAIFELIADVRSSPEEKLARRLYKRPSSAPTKRLNWKLPDSRPDFVTEKEWELLTDMSAADPVDTPTIADVVYRMEDLVREQGALEIKQEVQAPTETTKDVSKYVLPSADETVEELLHDVKDMCDQLPEFNAVDRSVYSRLRDVYEQLVSAPAPLPVSLVESFSLLLWRFFVLLEQRADGFSSAGSLCASRTVANRNYSLHREIDGLLLSSPSLQDAAEVHRWQPSWKKAQLMQLEAMRKFLADPSSVLNQLKCDDERAEAMSLLHAEARDYHYAYSAAVGGAVPDEKIPKWFIPAHQIELGKHIADGSFGSVYYGKWLGTDVVVKQLSSHSLDKASREQFRREADIWFNLNHSNLITMYGACYERRPFFVCERAHRKNLVASAKKQLPLKVWGWLCHAALGLQHLHDRGIVHGDLKCNNILICDGVYETAKLTDFGLSMFADQPESPHGEGVLGAIRWKAPECLLGSRPTFKSDIFSFGMCIIEVKTGAFPWGRELPDSAVQFNVTHGSELPQRPDSFEDREWDLVERMCCFNPDDRISVGAVVNILRVFAAEGVPASRSSCYGFDDSLDDSD